MARKKFSKALKARVALEAIKGQKTINEIASENDIHLASESVEEVPSG